MRIHGALLAAGCIIACTAPPTDIPPTHTEAGAGDAPLQLPDAQPDGALPTSTLPECGAQRVVHLVAGNGGLAWFTQIWPVPDVITQFDPAYAYDDPSRAVSAPVNERKSPSLRARLPRWSRPSTHGTNAHADGLPRRSERTHTRRSPTKRTWGRAA